MTLFRTLARPIRLVAAHLLALHRQTDAYIDPGVGSYFAQILFAAILGLLASAGLFWGRIKEFVRGLTSRKEPLEPGQENGDET